MQIRIGAQMITLAPAMFESFSMPPPPEYGQGYQAYTAGELPKALVLIKSVTDRYKGLPTDWAQYATGMLGDIYVASGDFTKAEAAYNAVGSTMMQIPIALVPKVEKLLSRAG